MVVVAAAAATTSCPRTQKKAPNPFPSLRRRDTTSSTRPPLSPSEKDNAAGPKRPRAKEINSRYLAFSSSSASAAKGGSFSSSPASSSSKDASFSSSSCSASTASSSSSSSTVTSSPRRFRSPLPASRPFTPAALPKTCMPNRSKSVDRARPGGTATPRAAHNPAALSSVARALRTTTRSLSVSFQGESFSYQSSKIGPTSPSPKNRKPTPERRGPTAPAATPARSCFKLENSRPLDSHHRWPAATSQQFNSLTRSLDCSVGEKDSFLAAVRSLRQSMALNEGARRASFDGGDFSLSVDTESLSSGSNSGTHESINLPPRGRVTPHGTVAPSRLLPEKGHRLHRLPDPGTQQPLHPGCIGPRLACPPIQIRRPGSTWRYSHAPSGSQSRRALVSGQGSPNHHRSLSVSFQGESSPTRVARSGRTSPSPKNRKPTPERRGPTAPAATPARSCFKLENSRPLDSHHRWPAATSQQFNSLTRSLDCSVGEKDSFLAAVRSLRQSMALNEGARRASFDGGDFSLSVDTESLSSGSNSGTHESINLPPRGRVTPHGTVAPSRLLPEKGHRLHRLPDPGTQQPSPNLKSVASSKFVPAKKSLMNGLLSSPFVAAYSHHSFVRPSSPGKLSATSPGGMPGVQRVPSSPAKSSSTVLLPGNAPSIFSFASDIKRGKNGESHIEDAHQLRLLYNRYLQWRWVNAQVHDSFLVQKLTAEKYLSNVWMTTTKMHEPIAIKKLKVQTDRQHVKLRSILKAHMSNLEEWSLIDHDHSIALSGTLGALKTSSIRLPVVNGAKVDFQEVRNAVGSAIDVMQAIGTSIYTLLSKVEGRSSIMSELAELATKEQTLMDQCKDLLSMVSAMHVKQCSLFGHVIQTSRPSLIQL
ncbi:hypothetical protein C4D60_Mb09t08660 [Musa balbisiana]|uniref:Uncharacterized protein n=1 Tax=Musa balbisiana TaxID=52838 RepID=A0A4V6T409_MUSBA|nr:hypothetical protein C4D60_Mb09t08660 [Musa balbisiana]